MNNYCVYKHTSPSGKVYIGIAKDVKHRWRGDGRGYKGSTRFWYAIQKYGWDNFKHEILAEKLSKEDACSMEIDLIEKCQSMNPAYGYNLTTGGENFTFSPESIEKLRLSQMGHDVPDHVKDTLRKCKSIPIVCLETGEIYENALVAAEDTNLCYTSIRKNVRGLQSKCGDFHFAKLSDYENGTIPEFVAKPSVYRKVLCETTGEIFDNISDASRRTGLSRRSLSYACNGKNSTCGKKKWRFIDTPWEDKHGK